MGLRKAVATFENTTEPHCSKKVETDVPQRDSQIHPYLKLYEEKKKQHEAVGQVNILRNQANYHSRSSKFWLQFHIPNFSTIYVIYTQIHVYLDINVYLYMYICIIDNRKQCERIKIVLE